MKEKLRLRVQSLLVAIDLIGTALFAAEGASTAVRAKLDLLGVLVLAFVTAVGGGLIRDVLLGDIPPGCIKDWRYSGIAFVTGLAVFALQSGSGGWLNDHWIVALDAAGLSFFAVAGATKALEFNLHPLLAIMMGGITGVGGGTLRDLLIGRIPSVLVSDIYASAALLGSLIAVVLLRLKARAAVADLSGIMACFMLRMLAVKYGWSLPGAHH